MQLEKDIERYLKKQIEARKGLCWKFTSPGTSGVPDRVVMADGVVAFIELKRPEGTISRIQEVRIEEMRQRGIWVEVLWSKWDVDRFLRTLDFKRGR